MERDEFLSKIALTLELSIRMADSWLEKLNPTNEEEKKRYDDYVSKIKELEIEVYKLTKEKHDTYEEN